MSDKVYSMADHSYYIDSYDGITVAINGGDDDYLAIEIENNGVEGDESPRGQTQWNTRVATKGTVTISLQWGSNENDKLNQMWFDQQAGRYLGGGIVKRQTTSENTDVWKHTTRSFIQKPPVDNLKAKGGPRVWVIAVEGLKPQERTVELS